MGLAAMGAVHFQHCFPGCTETLHIRLNAGRRRFMGVWAKEEERSHDSAPDYYRRERNHLSAIGARGTAADDKGHISIIDYVTIARGRNRNGPG
jgi:hypothetical protein